MTSPISKTQRLLDLISYLAGRHVPATIEEIMEVVPCYDRDVWREGSKKERESLRRKFERDKDDLRQAGIPIQSVKYRMGVHDSIEGYLLEHRDFYLPYLKLVEESEESGRKSAKTVEWTHEDMEVALYSMRVAENTPGFPLRPAIRSAFRKLAFDLDLEAFSNPAIVHTTPIARAGDPATVSRLVDAAEDRKFATLTYEGAQSGETTERRIDPYGTFMQHGQWYTVGRCHLRDGLRVFRVSRIIGLTVNSSSPKTPDFDIPSGFNLKDYLGRNPWDLGADDAEPISVDVHFDFPRSTWASANDLGDPIDDHSDGSETRRFQVRNANPFLRWVLSMAGEARILAPESLRSEFLAMASRIAERHSPENDDE